MMQQKSKQGIFLYFISVCAPCAMLFGGLFLASCKSSDSMLGVKLDFDVRALSNGLTVVMVEDHTAPVISYQTWVRAGSVDEEVGKTGIAHLFEHLMFKGTRRFGPKEFFTRLEARGAEVNAFTTRDYTAYYENFTPDLLPEVIELEADRLANLNVTDEMLAIERQVVLEERRLRTDNNPAGRMQEVLWNTAYDVHPYRWPVIGVPQDLLSITPDDLNSFFKKHYQPGNIVLVIVGDIDREAAFSLIKKAYGGIKGQGSPKREIPSEPKPRAEKRVVLKDHVAAEKILIGYPVTSADQQDSYALDVLANILFAGTSSRAYRRIVDKEDLALGISGSAFTPTYPGLLVISATMKGGVPSSRLEASLEEVFKEVQVNGVTKEDVDRAVKQLTVEVLDSVRTPHGLGQFIGTVLMVLGDIDHARRDLEKYLKVTPKDVQRVSKAYLQPGYRTVVTLVPDSQKLPKSQVSQESEFFGVSNEGYAFVFGYDLAHSLLCIACE